MDDFESVLIKGAGLAVLGLLCLWLLGWFQDCETGTTLVKDAYGGYVCVAVSAS
jgi:hypothetical protein